MFISNFMNKVSSDLNRFGGGITQIIDTYYLIEIKSAFSICLIKYHTGENRVFRTSPYLALTWFIKGEIIDQTLNFEWKKGDG